MRCVHHCNSQSKLSALQGYNDNSGLGPILSEYLSSGSDRGQILVLVMNQLGDNQMETYFNYSAGGGGLLCWDETMETGLDGVFRDMTGIHKQALEAVGGKYMPAKHEPIDDEALLDEQSPCPIRLARSVFFEVHSRSRCPVFDGP